MFSEKNAASSNVIDIAKTIVNRCLKRGYKISPQKLEKMMIIVYGEYLVKTRKRLFDAKIFIGKKGIGIKEIQKKYNGNNEFKEFFYEEKLFLVEEEKALNKLIDIYGNQNLVYINTDLRLMALSGRKRIIKTISDLEMFELFLSVPGIPINTPLLCSASEKAKWIINECLKKGYDINTYKLEKLLILAYGTFLIKTGTKLFKEKIVICDTGPMIKEVDKDFRRYSIEFHSPFAEYYCKLYSEENLIQEIISVYGEMSGFELNSCIILKELAHLKDGNGFVTDDDIKSVFEKYAI